MSAEFNGQPIVTLNDSEWGAFQRETIDAGEVRDQYRYKVRVARGLIGFEDLTMVHSEYIRGIAEFIIDMTSGLNQDHINVVIGHLTDEKF